MAHDAPQGLANRLDFCDRHRATGAVFPEQCLPRLLGAYRNPPESSADAFGDFQFNQLVA